jgi:SWI/SNF-related matrix-associated actin-dependent regulator 1 of chromatin subfamily A
LPPCPVEEEPEEIREVLERERERVEVALAAGGETDLGDLAPAVPTLRRWNALRKLVPLGDLLADELARKEYRKVVVFAAHRQLVEGLAERLAEFRPAVIHGGVPSGKRGEIVERFQADSTCRVFLGNLHAAGTGLTLCGRSGCHHVVLAEQDWTPAVNEQALARVVRIGQDRGVFVRVVELEDSLDQRISAVLVRKLREISGMWGGD